MPLTFSLLEETFAVSRLDPTDAVPTWAISGAFFTVSRSSDELSVLCEADLVPPDVRSEGGWRALKLHGPFDFALTGVLASILAPLAQAGVGIFAVSTFDTDFILVKAERLDDALSALQSAGHALARR
ncbi:ACT domain-containing protein [Deinococcus yavapaiensis]|uniref:Uncharacterized protein n=1 Tax=Deinococcus yavapaiensis KR-236 TaxID=694435 RepID=A0A318S7C2_9DEIO|nr:ACT domain-containing protein [Deinococcus yavapaiensis]PYE54231.1 hypothetical protein DES52_106197 [Deinococcus yavapaiensis KR-236]